LLLVPAAAAASCFASRNSKPFLLSADARRYSWPLLLAAVAASCCCQPPLLLVVAAASRC